MDLSSLIDDTPLSSAQIVGPADALLTDATDALMHAQDPVLATTQPAGGGAASPIDGLVPLATDAAEGLGSGTVNDAGANPALLGPAGGVGSSIQALSAQPVEQLANNGVLDFHYTLETIAHRLALADGLHGLTNFGETVGLGHIGQPNLVTDLLDTPTALANRDLSPVMNVPTDLGNIYDAAQLLVSDLALDVANANAVLTDPVGHLESAIPVLEAFPATALANEAVDAANDTLGSALDPLLPGTTSGIAGLDNALGGGDAGAQNVLSDLTSAPAALLSGDTNPLTHLPSDVAQVGGSLGGVLDGIGSDLSGSSLLGALTDPATGGGILGGDLPGQGALGALAGLGDGAVNGIGGATGLGGLTQALTDAAGSTTGGSSSPVTSLLHLPGDILGGASNGAAPLPGDGGATFGSLGAVVGAAAGEVSQLGSGSGLLAPVTGALTSGALGGGAGSLLSDPIGTLGHADPTGLVSTVAGATAPVTSGGAGGLVGALTGALGGGSGSGSGSHDLLSLTAGPQTPTSGLGLNALDSSPSGQTHVVDTNVGTAGAPAPTVATISVLPDSIQLPTAASGGSDALSGILQAVTGSGAPTSGGASANAGIDLGVAHVDLPVAAAHSDPLGALGLAAHHA